MSRQRMNGRIRLRLLPGTLAGGLLMASLGAAAPAAAPPPAGNEDFFIVSSVDLGHGTMVLKRPTEVTLTMRVTPKTRCRDERGKTIELSSLRAGDTVFIAAAPDSSGQLVATTIRQGVMTPQELKKRYLRPQG
jgi:hypothetical protein